jgi:predicted RNase H-like HicB family nuclease
MDYLVIIEETNTGFSAYAPDLPGCIATGKTLDATRKRMREAVEFHIEGLRLEALPRTVKVPEEGDAQHRRPPIAANSGARREHPKPRKRLETGRG